MLIQNKLLDFSLDATTSTLAPSLGWDDFVHLPHRTYVVGLSDVKELWNSADESLCRFSFVDYLNKRGRIGGMSV